jgi:hypothetical protein
MRRLTRTIMLALLVTGLTPLAFAQGQKAGDGDEVLSRTIRQRVREGKTDGMEVTIYEVQGEKDAEKLIPVLDTSRTFKNNDALRVEFTSSINGFVYFINITPEGKKVVIYPDIRVPNQTNQVVKGTTYRLPEGQEPFDFEGEEKGVEIIQVIMSRQRIPFFDKAIRDSKGVLGADSASAAAELVSLATKKKGDIKGGIDTETTANVLPQNIASDVGTRDIRLKVFAPKDKDEKGTVIAIPDGLKEGGVAVFEIRLRHM